MSKSTRSQTMDIEDIIDRALTRQKETFKESLRIFMDATNKRLDDFMAKVQTDLSELKQSVEFTQSEVDTIKMSTTKIQDNRLSIMTIETELKGLEGNIDYLDNQARRNNLRIDGIDETPNETWENTEEHVKRELVEKLNFTSEQVRGMKIERAHRVNTLNRNNKRPIVAKFASFKDRELILKTARLRRVNGFYVNEDFSSKVAGKRRQLLPEMYKARDDGKIAYLSFDKLVIKEGNQRTVRH